MGGACATRTCTADGLLADPQMFQSILEAEWGRRMGTMGQWRDCSPSIFLNPLPSSAPNFSGAGSQIANGCRICHSTNDRCAPRAAGALARAGLIDSKETAQDAALRELREETGYHGSVSMVCERSVALTCRRVVAAAKCIRHRREPGLWSGKRAWGGSGWVMGGWVGGGGDRWDRETWAVE